MENEIILSARGLDLYYGANQALKNVNIDIPERQVTAPVSYTHLTLPTTERV